MSGRSTILSLLILSTAACLGCERSYVTYRLVSENGRSIEPNRLADDCYENKVMDTRISGALWYGVDSVFVVGDCSGTPDINRLRVYDTYSGYIRQEGDTLYFYDEGGWLSSVALLRGDSLIFRGYGLEQPLVFVRLDSPRRLTSVCTWRGRGSGRWPVDLDEVRGRCRAGETLIR
jgi:hypothetical protein